MKERVEQVRQQRETAARGRDRRLWPTVGIVGYTNAGKSTLLNALVGSEVALAEDKLFATLDPTSRQVKLGDGQTAIVTDTVGFIHKLPAPAGRRLPGDARGGQPGRRPDRGRRRVGPRTSTSTGRPSRPSSTSSAPARSRGWSPSTRPTCSTRPRATARRPAPAIAGAVFVSALTGYGMDTLRAEIAALLASLWVDVDVDAAVHGGRAAGAGPRARHGRARVRRARRPRLGPGRAVAGRRAGRGRRDAGMARWREAAAIAAER